MKRLTIFAFALLRMSLCTPESALADAVAPPALQVCPGVTVGLGFNCSNGKPAATATGADANCMPCKLGYLCPGTDGNTAIYVCTLLGCTWSWISDSPVVITTLGSTNQYCENQLINPKDPSAGYYWSCYSCPTGTANPGPNANGCSGPYSVDPKDTILEQIEQKLNCSAKSEDRADGPGEQ